MLEMGISFAAVAVRRALGGLGAWLALLGLLLGLGCGTSEGVTCCDCTCCDQDSHHTRETGVWVDCSDPCTVFCERDLGCPAVTLAEPCDE